MLLYFQYRLINGFENTAFPEHNLLREPTLIYYVNVTLAI